MCSSVKIVVFKNNMIIIMIIYKLKGLEALKTHFKNSKFPYEMEHYLPVVFSPPRDGKQLTEPLAIVGHKHPLTITITIPIPIGPPSVGVASESGDLLCGSSSQNGGVEVNDGTTTGTCIE